MAKSGGTPKANRQTVVYDMVAGKMNGLKRNLCNEFEKPRMDTDGHR